MRLATEDHKVFFYGRPQELAHAVFTHICPAIEANSPVVLVMTPSHRQRLEQRLLEHDLCPQTLRDVGVLVQLDAEETLEKFLSGGALDEARFQQVIGGVLREAPQALTHAYGEMVDVLVKRQRFEAAIELEEMWNRLARQHRFTLLCGYEMNVFGGGASANFIRHACGVHNRVESTDRDHDAAFVIRCALENYFGSEQAAREWLRIAATEPALPDSYAVMLWLRANLPGLAEAVAEKCLSLPTSAA